MYKTTHFKSISGWILHTPIFYTTAVSRREYSLQRIFERPQRFSGAVDWNVWKWKSWLTPPEIWRGIYYIPPTNKKSISKRCFLFQTMTFWEVIWYTWDIIVTHGVDGIHKLDVSSSHDGHGKATALDTSHIYVNNLTWGCWKRTTGKSSENFEWVRVLYSSLIYCRNMLSCISEYTKDSMYYMFSIHLDRKNNLFGLKVQ